MRVRINQTEVVVLQGDITEQEVGAIVNAANRTLMGGGGVDGAIHRAAGPELLAESRTLGGCETGDAKITAGYHLPAKYVIHAVGPVYSQPNAPELLASAYRRSMEVAVEHDVKTMAFPCISTGVYGYPQHEAVKVVWRTLYDFLKDNDSRQEIRLVMFSSADMNVYRQFLPKFVDFYDDVVFVNS